MGTMIEKLLPGGVEVLDHNMPDQEAQELAVRVLAAYEAGTVQVRLTPLVWNAENAEYVLDLPAQKTLPLAVEETQDGGAVEFDIDTAGKEALFEKAAELGLDVKSKALLEDLRAQVKAALPTE